MILDKDTIAAISTPIGAGGIAVIRISGKAAVRIADKIFVGTIDLKAAESHKAYLGKIVEPSSGNQKSHLDEVILVLYRAPNSYTKEDVVEISCHGGLYLSHRILELVLKQGARLAEPGEFTQRAFLNGRLDLSQAEAVADLINAKTESSLKCAISQFQGGLSGQVKEIRTQLVDICSLIELELDFAEEDVEFVKKEEILNRLKTTMQKTEIFLKSFSRGKILREGVKLVIVGKPNVGKSSLLNALLKEERAIVTDIAGTTRDVLEEQIDIKGVFFRIVDTAGIRPASNAVEKEGVQRTFKQVQNARIILFLFDGSEALTREDDDLISQVLSQVNKNNRVEIISAINKVDLTNRIDKKEIVKKVGNHPILEISAKEHTGLLELEEQLLEHSVGKNYLDFNDPIITNVRQKSAFDRAMTSLINAKQSVENNLSGEFIALDLRSALDSLGEVIGEVTTEDILGNIFSKFCIGK